jgi:cytoplasmic iron level regulating protein YaaA (DUF328/UPF0246 family)
MLYAVISPAKKLAPTAEYNGATTQIAFKSQTKTLVNILKDASPDKLASLMRLSEKLAYLNFMRYQDFNASQYSCKNAYPAILLFQGDVYQGMQADSFTPQELTFCEKSLGILSGLYGVLSPLDLIQPYRLEMGTKLANPVGKNLYEFWREAVTTEINQRMKNVKAKYLINLASDEYFSVIDPKQLAKPIIKIDFKENQDGKLKTIGIHAKRARGAMVQFIVQERCKTLEGLQAFDGLGYCFDNQRSDGEALVFVR